MRGSIGAIGSIGHKRIVNPTGVPPSIEIPTEIDGCVLWLRTDSMALTADQTVTEWLDESGNGNHMQNVGAQNTLYKANQINGLPAIWQNGGNFRVYDDGGPWDLSVTYSIFAVCKANAACAGKITRNGLGGSYGLAWAPDDKYQIEYGGVGNFPTNEAHDAINYHILSLVRKAASAPVLLEDGVAYTHNCGVDDPNVPDGAFRYAAYEVEGYVAEIIAYNDGLSDSDQDLVTAYLSDKYDIAVA